MKLDYCPVCKRDMSKNEPLFDLKSDNHMERCVFRPHNPIARALRLPHLRPKKVNSKKIYKRKPKHKGSKNEN